MNYYLAHITYPIIFIAVLARQLWLPVPAILFLLSGGTLAGSGKLSYVGILLVAILGCVLADLVWFETGRVSGKRVVRLLCTLANDPSYCIRRGRAAFEKRGVRLLLIAKFFPGLDGITPPLAGMLGASRTAFLVHDCGGALLWAGAYISCGFLFAESLYRVERYISVYATALTLAFGVPLVLLFVWKLVPLVRMIQSLQHLQITPEQLKERLNHGDKIAIIDLLRFEEDPQGVSGIPGAVRLVPNEIRRKKHFRVPDDVDMVVYCRSQNSFVSARVAAAMRKHGLQRVHVLAGGLEAWKARGFPLSDQFADPRTELTRLGVEMSPEWQPLPASGVGG
ncbi:VTT domain-containing protein [Edaphobacter bradus]|uniref:VTT domain-containing protein n=1 Tax=Edaphobacter bradus TaxID=2259016 RepID=UPI0021E0DBCE|nr:rhodanese-like domain-containing protein [Edaphobacter bradus]